MRNRKICLIAAVLILGVLLYGCAASDGEADVTVPTVTEPQFITEGMPTIKETVLYNEDGIILSAREFGKLGDDYAISVILRNDSEQNMGVSTRALAVNGFMLSESGLECSTDAGGTHEEAYLILDADELASLGIDTVATVEFYLQFYAPGIDEWDVTDVILMETSAAKDFEQSVDDSGIEVYNENGIRIVYQGYEVDEYDDGYANFYLENNTDKNLAFICSDAKVNGAPRDSYLWTEVRPGSRAVGGVCFYGIGEVGIISEEELVTLGMIFSTFDVETAEPYAATPEIHLGFLEE